MRVMRPVRIAKRKAAASQSAIRVRIFCALSSSRLLTCSRTLRALPMLALGNPAQDTKSLAPGAVFGTRKEFLQTIRELN